MKFSRAFASMALAVAAGAAAPLMEGTARETGRVVANSVAKRRRSSVFGDAFNPITAPSSSPNGGRGGKHRTNSQNQRAAHKARNVRRHRAASHG